MLKLPLDVSMCWQLLALQCTSVYGSEAASLVGMQSPVGMRGTERAAARSPGAAEVATSSTPCASITSQAAPSSSKGRRQDLQHGR